jgi:glycosyltransferase involved in cell wall biosynthesis
MKANDYFCYPTMASEGFPKVVLEAMSQGLVVIATPVSILSTMLNDDNGILIKESSPILLSDEIIKLNKDKDQRSIISFNAIKTSNSYSLENWRNKIANHLSEAWNYNFKFSNHIP